MNKKELHKYLEGLRSEMNRLEDGDELIKERVNRLIIEVEHHLEHPDDTAHKETLNHSLHNSIEQFEVSHPRVTNILNQIMMTLSKIGI